MGNTASIRNETPYTWHFSTHSQGFQPIDPGRTASYIEWWQNSNYIHFRYKNHQRNSFTYQFNILEVIPTFILRETGDRSRISLSCIPSGETLYCPNYGKIKEDNQRREQQRLQERRIQEELDRESELSTLMLSQATERLLKEQSFIGHVHHEEHTQVLHQQREGDAAAIKRDEVAETETLFEALLLEFEISEDEGLRGCRIKDRIRTLQNGLAVRYCRENQLSICSMFTYDQAVEYSELSLTEKLNVLQASLNVTLNGVCNHDEDQPEGWERKYDFLFGLVEELYVTNPSLAKEVLLNILDSVSDLSPESKEILGHMLFNQIWMPTEIMLFIRQSSDIPSQQKESVLHTARTYHLDLDLTISALRNENPVTFLQDCIKKDKENDAKKIMQELRKAKCRENISALVQDVLIFLELKPPEFSNKYLNKIKIKNLKKKIQDLDLKSPDIHILKDVLTGISVAVHSSTTPKYFPRLTQLASLLLLLLSQQTGNKGCLLEIGTGEGKSCILAMFATIMAVRGIKVDIVTSSPVLARRDQEEWKKLLDMFGVSSSVVPPPSSDDEEQDKLIKSAYQQQIVYGTIGTFAADALKQEFEKKTTRDERPFELVIVDEVDYMTLDNGVQVTFLSHESSELRHMEQVLASIWAMVSSCQQIEMSETGEIKWTTRIQHFHKAITSAVIGQETPHFSTNEILSVGVEIGIFSQEDVETVCQPQNMKKTDDTSYEDDTSKALAEIMKKVTVSQQFDLLKIFEKVLENAVMIECYSVENQKAKPWLGESEKHGGYKIEMLLLEGGLACEIMSEESLIAATTEAIKSSIKYSDQYQTTEDSDNVMVVPTFLKSYVENQLPVFVRNALRAVVMCQGREYIIDVSAAAERKMPDGQEMHEYYAIIPVDFRASGILEKNKKWGSGLQQFLEFKHRLAVSPLSNVTNYMSNFHYFKRYISGKGIFGVSGTLGGDADRDFLVRHYKTNTYTVPSHRHRRVVELPAVQVNEGDEKWLQAICETASKAAKRGQVTLIICEDVKTANKLHEKLKKGGRFGPDRITLYTISETHNVEREKFGAGRVIIATNLGGRGTDIKVEEDVNQSGGLFVLLTHFPHNRRVEKQILGRTGRKGNPGMFQMVLNCDHLASAYQGQTVEIMRHLREEYEVKRMCDMESDELVEINLKEKLFATFCRFLKDFDGNYTAEERQDPLQKKLSKLPTCFTSSSSRFDYHPAINALKESWALWLTLHETEINNHDDFNKLESDLLKSLNETTEELLKGRRENFYDHIRQAVIRTDLHCRNKTRNDYGAKYYWQKVESSDPRYKAVALYNQAYITINLGQGDYRAEARRLLVDARKAIDAYAFEVSNTMMSVNLSVAEKSTKNVADINNFQSQMEVRMNIFQSWIKSINETVAKLDELEESKSDGITEESAVYSLSEEKDFITTNELIALYDFGLGFVFQVKKKPKFSFDALICFFLGVLQVFAGVLVCALSLGSASQFGLGLITEGVSDMISGIQGMITGTFSWASWAISKSISIGISLLTAGFSTIKKAVGSVYNVTKGLLDGTKSFSSVASGVITSGKGAFSLLKGSVGSFKSLVTSTALKQNLKHATKYAVQEIAKQSVITTMNLAVDKGVEELFKKVFKDAFESKVSSAVKHNSKLDETLGRIIVSGVSESALQKDHFKINKDFEKQLKITVDSICEKVVPNLMWNLTTAHEVIGRLSEMSNKATELMDKMKLSELNSAAQVILKLSDWSIHFAEILNSIPTKEIIDDKFVPDLLSIMENLQRNMAEYDQNDERHNLKDVQRLKAELLDVLAQKVSDQFLCACSKHATSLITKAVKSKLNRVAEQAVDRVTRRDKTQHFFDNQRHKYNMKSAIHQNVEHLSDEDREQLKQYTDEISNSDRPTSALDIYILTNSDLLNGKGIQLTVVDEHGNPLSEEHYQGTDKSAGDLKLRLTKYATEMPPSEKTKSMVIGETKHYAGHFEIVQDDGGIRRVNSDHQNCLYHAVAQAFNAEDPKQEALNLRQKVKDQVQSNLERYAPIINLQKEYELSHANSGKYTITGGTKEEIEDDLSSYEKNLNGIKIDERDLKYIRKYNLGFVSEYKNVITHRKNQKNSNKGMCEADHIPPKSCISQVLGNPVSANKLKNKNPKLYDMLSSNGRNMFAMEVLTKDHRNSLTTGASHHAKISREIIKDTIISGDGMQLLRECMILHHPFSSLSLRADLEKKSSSAARVPALTDVNPPTANESVSEHHGELSEDGVRAYYKVAYLNLVEEYSSQGAINQNQKKQLKQWVKENKHENTKTKAYKKILRTIKQRLRKMETIL